MFTTSADFTNLPTVAPDDEIVGFVGMAVLAVSLGLLFMNAATGLTLSVTQLAVSATSAIASVVIVIWMTFRAMRSVDRRVHRTGHILRQRFCGIQMTRFDATPMRASNTAHTFDSSVMAKVINGSIRRNWPNPMVVSPPMSHMDRTIATTRCKLAISIWTHVARPFQAAVRKAASFSEKAGLVVTLNLFGKQRITVTLPPHIVLSAPAPTSGGFVATLDRTIHRCKSSTRLVIGGQHE